MAKQPTPAAQVIDVPMNEALLSEDISAANQLALATAQQDSAVRAVALQMGYQLPADCTDPDLIQRDIASNMYRSVEACLEVGKGLRVLKEACGHGNFVARLETLNLDRHVAARFVSAAVKFSNVRSNAHLTKAIGNQTKLFEMICLDGDQLEELELTGQTGELALDDVATMSVKELRKAVREAKQEKDATDKLLETKNKQIDKLTRHIAKATPDEVLLELQKETTAFTNDALGCVQGQLRQAFIALKNHSTADHSLFMAGLVGQVQAELAALREEFNLPDISNARDQELAAEVAQWAFPQPENTAL
ncbi:hypothetical protein [Rhodoferax sp.]|uniref:hypothetical protein n=1 Tax=Rhodoferax sp. TaxID=50421 RepID=UPI002633A570|nr:hypothetical protein [Rhodoferax sp.]MDD5479667.1 hypothetical protein [Rhodoferax sp.]